MGALAARREDWPRGDCYDATLPGHFARTLFFSVLPSSQSLSLEFLGSGPVAALNSLCLVGLGKISISTELRVQRSMSQPKEQKAEELPVGVTRGLH